MSTHPSPEALAAYLAEGRADPELEAHLAGCSTCAAALQREASLELRLLELGEAVAPCPGCARPIGADRCDHCGAARRAGPYTVERLLVRSAHGRLYLARDAAGRALALKELAFVHAPDHAAIERFAREAQILRSLEHPAIPRFRGSFVEGEGVHTRFYLAQDHVRGRSLAELLPETRWGQAELAAYLEQGLQILAYLQELLPPVFHRDVKPANLILTPEGRLVLVDFGAARELATASGTTALGTFGYMPVEQHAGIVDATTDVFALGMTMLHLITHHEPWRITEVPASLPLSPPLRAVLARMTARDPARRYPSARAALAALRAPAEREAPRTRPWVMVLAALAFAALGGAFFFAAGGARRGGDAASVRMDSNGGAPVVASGHGEDHRGAAAAPSGHVDSEGELAGTGTTAAPAPPPVPALPALPGGLAEVPEPPPPPPGGPRSLPRGPNPPSPPLRGPVAPRPPLPPGSPPGSEVSPSGPCVSRTDESGYLTLAVMPTGSSYRILRDGQVLGESPVSMLKVPAGCVELLVRRADGEARPLRLSIRPNAVSIFRVDFSSLAR